MFKTIGVIAASSILLASAGCETKAQSGVLIGGLSGAALGGLIGSNSHARAGEGAAIGAVAGAIGGGLIGHGMDKADERNARAQDRTYYESERRSAAYAYESPSRGTASRITKQEVISWSDRGVKDELIIDRIERSGQVFRVTAADENELRDAGVSEPVIRSMKNTARR